MEKLTFPKVSRWTLFEVVACLVNRFHFEGVGGGVGYCPPVRTH